MVSEPIPSGARFESQKLAYTFCNPKTVYQPAFILLYSNDVFLTQTRQQGVSYSILLTGKPLLFCHRHPQQHGGAPGIREEEAPPAWLFSFPGGVWELWG